MLHPFHSIRLRVAHCFPLRASPLSYNLTTPLSLPFMAKRKRSAVAAASPAPAEAELSSLDRLKITHTEVPLPTNVASGAPKPTRRQSSRGEKSAPTNPDTNPEVLDGISALRASPDGHEVGNPESHLAPGVSNGVANGYPPDVDNQMAPPAVPAGKSRGKKASVTKIKIEPEESKVSKQPASMADDPEAADGLEEDETEFKEALSRPPPVNSDYLPLPWKGRLGYVR